MKGLLIISLLNDSQRVDTDVTCNLLKGGLGEQREAMTSDSRMRESQQMQTDSLTERGSRFL